MIQANDLRIGNWFYIGEMIGQCNPDSLKDTSIFEPIPLSKEVLRTIGEPKEDGWIYLPKNFRVCCAEVTGLCNFSMGMTETGSDEIDWFIVSLPTHLHQLQNLYYSLTGVELEVVW